MLALRQLTILNSIIRTPFLCRQYVQKPIKTKNRKNMSTKQIHKEVMKYVNKFPKITIVSDIYVKVYAADLHRYPNSDVLIGELHGAHAKNCENIINLSVNVSDDEKNIDIRISKLQRGVQDFHCEFAVPVKATLFIEGKDNVSVEHMLGDEVKVYAEGNIKTRDVRCENVLLKSGCGNINCAGTLMGKNILLQTRHKGCILLDKLQGDELVCKTEAGDVHTNCCYVESSSFETDSGCLELKNVHKEVKVLVQKQDGALHMSGVHGKLQVQMNGCIMKLQLSELCGESNIVADNIESAIINISNEIEQSTELNIQARSIYLNQTLQYLTQNLAEHNQKLIYNTDAKFNKLIIRCIKGNVILGKQSWAEMMCGNIKQNNNLSLT